MYRKRQHLNHDWQFTHIFTPDLLNNTISNDDLAIVSLPHTVIETPFNYFSEKSYQMHCGYRKKILIDKDTLNQRYIITFEGAAHKATIYLNGKKIAEHLGGYTAFKVDITNNVKGNADNTLVVELDSRENLNIPPFGNVIDYLTYGGLYREVYLDILPNTYIEDIYVATPSVLKEAKKMVVQTKIKNLKRGNYHLKYNLEDNGEICHSFSSAVKDESTISESSVKGVALWQLNAPKQYNIICQLIKDDIIIDQTNVYFGFREAVFLADGFYLNGTKIKLRGINRHQAYPYVGYAMPKRAQVYDADILKDTLGLNAVRTSHYPQSKHFIKRCDQLGLLVFTEIPGWQHVGDSAWQDTALQFVEEMILQYRNHPSIILWGVRINESPDDDDFYQKTNAIAHKYDPYRQTGGVRFIKKSHLLEDVYTFNDFSHTGNNFGVLAKEKVTSDMAKSYLVSEYNGHMYPTKVYDDAVHRTKHALRHAKVLNDIASYNDIAGGFGWCMFDYNTHLDFGSGDCICHHGVLDMFRNPKLAAAVYSSQSEKVPVLAISSDMNIGEYPAGRIGCVYAFSNGDAIDLYKNDMFIKRFTPSKDYPHMIHPPFVVDDFIGDMLSKNEDYNKKTGESIKKLLLAMAKHDVNLPLKYRLSALRLRLLKGLSQEKLDQLYNKYVANWGSKGTAYRFEVIKDGKCTMCVKKSFVQSIHLDVTCDTKVLEHGDTYDVATVNIIAKDQNDNVLTYLNAPIKIKIEGPLQLIGPAVFSLQGGMAGTYLKSIKKEGVAAVYFELLGYDIIADLKISQHIITSQ